MQIQLVMTVIGADRVGLVESIARLVAEHGGNWLESRMCRLGGEFAGILRVEIAAAQRAGLEKALAGLTDLNTVVRAASGTEVSGATRLASLEVVGPDRPGIVKEITTALAAQGANVEELATECVSAPMSGELLFQARAKVRLPGCLQFSALREALEKSVTGMTVEVSLLNP